MSSVRAQRKRQVAAKSSAFVPSWPKHSTACSVLEHLYPGLGVKGFDAHTVVWYDASHPAKSGLTQGRIYDAQSSPGLVLLLSASAGHRSSRQESTRFTYEKQTALLNIALPAMAWHIHQYVLSGRFHGQVALQAVNDLHQQA